MEKRIQDEKLAVETAKLEKEKADKESKKNILIAFKSRVKELIELLKVKLPETRYDRFWVETIVKKHNTIDKINLIIEVLEKINEKTFPERNTKEFEAGFGELNQTEAERAEKLRLETLMKEEQKKEELTDVNWTDEEVKLLTKGIAKFPPGTTQRWAVIAEFIGNKTQKEVIKKA